MRLLLLLLTVVSACCLAASTALSLPPAADMFSLLLAIDAGALLAHLSRVPPRLARDAAGLMEAHRDDHHVGGNESPQLGHTQNPCEFNS